jgi:hypothetical protein
MHPDQHAIIFVPSHPDLAIIGSDGGVIRTSGAFADASTSCDTRGLVDPQLTQCHQWLSAVPTQLFSMNSGLATLQFQSLSLNLKTLGDVAGGTQDNGTWASRRQRRSYSEAGGDGGSSGTDVAMPRSHAYLYRRGGRHQFQNHATRVERSAYQFQNRVREGSASTRLTSTPG